MNLSGESRIEAPREAVYAALNDPDVLQRAIPGCEAIEKQSETEMTAAVVAKVGPVKARFNGAVTLRDLDPPRGYTIAGEGKGGAAGFASGSARVRLDEDGPATILRYDVDAKVGGKLAQLGARLIDGTARKMAEQFFANFGGIMAERVAAPADDTAPAVEAPAPEPRPAAVDSAGGNRHIAWWIIGAAMGIIALYLLAR